MEHRWAAIRLLSMALLALPLAGCAKEGESRVLPFMASPVSPDKAPVISEVVGDTGSPILSGVWLSINVNDNPVLSRVVRVTFSGDIGLPRIGKIHVEGLSGQAAAHAVMAKAQKFDPLISKVIVGFFQPGPVYVLGEVRQAGEFAFHDGAVLADLVDQAGGLTYRADARRVFITRYNQPMELELPMARTTQIMPGDVIRVPQRYF